MRCLYYVSIRVIRVACVNTLATYYQHIRPGCRSAEGGGIPTGGVLEVVSWQSDLLSWAGKGAQEGNKPGVCRL